MINVRYMKRSLAIFLSLLLLSLPLITYASDSKEEEKVIRYATEKGREDAIISNGTRQKALWFGIGFLFNVVGVGASLLFVPGPNIPMVLGKPSKALKAYVDEYKMTKRNKQFINSSFGCLVGTVVVLATYSIYVSVALLRLALYGLLSIVATAGH